jgi:hypothetical protein
VRVNRSSENVAHPTERAYDTSMGQAKNPTSLPSRDLLPPARKPFQLFNLLAFQRVHNPGGLRAFVFNPSALMKKLEKTP